MAKMVILVPQDRSRCGRAIVVTRDGRTLASPIRILATASARVAREHGNPERSPLLPFGHPPAGSYAIVASLPPGTPHRRQDRYGGLGALLLEPRAGAALQAFATGRRRFALHGGRVDARGRLRPTRGGFRVADDDLAALFRALNIAYGDGDAVRGVEVLEVEAPERAGSDARPGSPGGNRTTTAGRSTLAIPLVALATMKWLPGGTLAPGSRRAFLQTMGLLAAAMGVSACGGGSEGPSPFGPHPGDPGDAGPGGCSGATTPWDDGGSDGGGQASGPPCGGEYGGGGGVG